MSESNSSPVDQETKPELRVFMKPPRTPEALLEAILKLCRRLTGREPTETELEEARAVIAKRFAERERQLSGASSHDAVETNEPPGNSSSE